MANALYRKYRPQKFAEVIGQEPVKTILKNAVKQGRVSHAYLFCGPRGVGKTTVARILARVVNCTAVKDGEPCGVCENCRAINENRFLDLVEIDAASYTGVDNIRELIEHVKFSPSRGKYKVFIVDEVHMLSKAAFNALLKTLEEPPRHAIFVLATTEAHKVPATIISRTQRFDFRTLAQAEILELLAKVLHDEELNMPLEAQRLIAQAAEGSLRDALSILDQVTSFAGKDLTTEVVEEILGLTRIGVLQKFLELLAGGNAEQLVALIKALSAEGKDLAQFTKNLLEYLRLVLFVKMDPGKLAETGFTAEDQAKLVQAAKSISGAELLKIIKAVLEAYRETRAAPVPELPLLLLALQFQAKSQKPGPPAGPLPENPAALELGQIIDRWAEVLARIKEYNHSLISSLRLGRVVRLEGGNLFLAFPYSFHKETIEARKNRVVVEQVLSEVFSQNLKIKSVLEREVKELSGDHSPDLVAEAMRVLKGEDQ
ncbi:MAG: DNA polymerase III subunit gamma/tau [Candidatus Doudnabacteria bacterium]|nr:DNA polymerase III subunit gamma/tau [Candidatus Doudnabacteria bacterium]